MGRPPTSFIGVVIADLTAVAAAVTVALQVRDSCRCSGALWWPQVHGSQKCALRRV